MLASSVFSVSRSLLLIFISSSSLRLFFFFNDPATTAIYPLSLHDALPIFSTAGPLRLHRRDPSTFRMRTPPPDRRRQDRKSTRLNSSHVAISYAVFCLKKKKKQETTQGVQQRQ